MAVSWRRDALRLAEANDQRAARHHWRTQREQQPKHSLPHQDWVEKSLHDRPADQRRFGVACRRVRSLRRGDRLLVY
jgi:hypothetical protein